MSNILHQPYFLHASSNIPPATMQVIAILNSMATAVDLKTQIKQAYWNVTGSNCEPLRELFAEIATQLEER